VVSPPLAAWRFLSSCSLAVCLLQIPWGFVPCLSYGGSSGHGMILLGQDWLPLAKEKKRPHIYIYMLMYTSQEQSIQSQSAPTHSQSRLIFLDLRGRACETDPTAVPFDRQRPYRGDIAKTFVCGADCCSRSFRAF
jgi:hypothetical protein